jgi:hypothetical protein
MSAASTPAPRSKSSSDSRPSSSGHALFLPILIYLIGAGALSIYQVMAMEDKLDEITQSIDKMDNKVKRAEYEEAKFYAIARDVMNLAPKDPNAAQVATDFKLKQLAQAQPALMSMSGSTQAASSLLQTTNPTTNAAPADASPATNAAPDQIPVPATK